VCIAFSLSLSPSLPPSLSLSLSLTGEEGVHMLFLLARALSVPHSVSQSASVIITLMLIGEASFGGMRERRPSKMDGRLGIDEHRRKKLRSLFGGK
jgi:hypothetical protein